MFIIPFIFFLASPHDTILILIMLIEGAGNIYIKLSTNSIHSKALTNI